MKKKTTELNVDFIGGQGPLTTEEEQALSEYFRSKKIKSLDQTKEKIFPFKKAA